MEEKDSGLFSNEFLIPYRENETSPCRWRDFALSNNHKLREFIGKKWFFNCPFNKSPDPESLSWLEQPGILERDLIDTPTA